MIIKCLHCNEKIEILESELNCRIFRHGVFKDTMEQIDPHGSKEYCDNLLVNNLIYGCGRPFRINLNNEVEICDYI